LLKLRIIKAISACIRHDDKATIKGQELLRAVASCLGCPIPPFMQHPQIVTDLVLCAAL